MRNALPGDAPRPFVLLDAVSEAGPERLTAWRRFGGAPFWQGLEAAAQAAALHQRFLSGFSRHAFLLSVDESPFPEAPLRGTVEIRACVLGRSLSAATYRVDLFPRALPGGDGPAAGFSWPEGEGGRSPGMAHASEVKTGGPCRGVCPDSEGLLAQGSVEPGGTGHRPGLGPGGARLSPSAPPEGEPSCPSPVPGPEEGRGRGPDGAGGSPLPGAKEAALSAAPGERPCDVREARSGSAGRGGVAAGFPAAEEEGGLLSDGRPASSAGLLAVPSHPGAGGILEASNPRQEGTLAGVFRGSGGRGEGPLPHVSPDTGAAWTVFLSIGLAPYGETFRRDALESRYRRLFQWLTRNARCGTVSKAG